MKYLLTVLFLLVSNSVLAADWLCTEEASLRQGNSILSCGVGLAWAESTARSKALDHAQAEFHKICSLSSDCIGMQVIVEPKRTACDALPKGGYKCYRLISFNILHPNILGESPSLKKGMKKAQLLALLGAPESIGHEKDLTRYDYVGDMCSEGMCFVYLKDGEVESTMKFRGAYVAEMD